MLRKGVDMPYFISFHLLVVVFFILNVTYSKKDEQGENRKLIACVL